jgi:acyl-coenzyme A synthetase/AMP-(fatty) acid ligase/DNA-binding NarL/FixJ family response regulator
MENKFKILVVDDDPYILLSLEFLMKKGGYEVMIARNGKEALDTIQSYYPHLVLLDIMMPDVDGFAICSYIKAQPHLEHCKVVFISAKSKEADIKKGMEHGAAMYITKPFSTRMLMQQVETLLKDATMNTKVMRYATTYEESVQNPTAFWGKQATEIQWFKSPQQIFTAHSSIAYEWFSDGITNMCYNCLDVHVQNGKGNQVALIYDSPVTQTAQQYTYQELLQEVALMAGAMHKHGVTKGDRVVIYMPMIPQAVIAMLACARIGAVHSVVFGGFAPHELALRINDATPVLLLTASYGVEFDQWIPYKPLVDAALQETQHAVGQVWVYQRPGLSAQLNNNHEMSWTDAMAGAQPIQCMPMASTDPLYILYTSGTTGKPKGIVRDHGGYAVALKYSMQHIYNIQANQVFWAASDVGWVVGHSYIVYGPLLQGCATVLYEGKPIRTPDASAFWRVISQYGVTTFFVAPTAIRAIKKEDAEGKGLQGKNISALRQIFVAGERCDPATLHWLTDLVKVPVIDHWWQTESGWPMLSVMMGLEPIPVKAGSAGKPVCGFQVEILDEEGTPVLDDAHGYVTVKLPLPPGVATTLWNNKEGYINSYLEKFPGYYNTGDGGYKDGDGYYYIMGRVDDVINVAGHRLSTGEMEELLAMHYAVAECAVIGIADALKGQIPIGLIVLKDGVKVNETMLEKELSDLIRHKIGPIACFKTVVWVQKLPKTRSGKILRKTLRAIADGEPYNLPSTIEDPLVLQHVTEKIQERGVGMAFQ